MVFCSFSIDFKYEKIKGGDWLFIVYFCNKNVNEIMEVIDLLGCDIRWSL